MTAEAGVEGGTGQQVYLGNGIMAKVNSLLGQAISPFAVYDYETAAAYLNVSAMTIFRAVSNGRLKGGSGRVTGRALLRWVELHGARSGRNKGDVEAERARASRTAVAAD